MIVDFHDDQNQSVRNEAKKVTKLILEKYKNWKNDVIEFRPITLEKIDRILKSITSASSNSWIEAENKEFNRILISRTMTAKYFEKEYTKFEEYDKNYNAKKNWKERIKLVNEVFHNAFEYPQEFETNSNAKKYILIAYDHLDEKNPGLLLNALALLNKSLDSFPSVVAECLYQLFEKTLCIIEVKKTEIGQKTQKFLTKVYSKIELNKVSKELLKVSVSGNTKIRSEALVQLVALWKASETLHQSLQAITIKVLQKLSVDPQSEEKVREVIEVGVRKFGG